MSTAIEIRTGPRHRKCTKPRHHRWVALGHTGTGWLRLKCEACGAEDI
jgi:hypothetical protein